MNDCQQSVLIDAYHDGEMSPDDRVQFARHLERCPQCAAELRRLQALTAVMGSLRPAAVPPAALQRMHRAASRLPSTGVVRLAEVLAGIAAMILMVCTFSLMRDTPAQAASSGVAPWEIEAIVQPSPEPAAGSEDQLAQWMVQDLSQRDQHD